jgi:predicted nucleic acid-binding protein
VRFWDTSAIVPLLSDEATTDAITSLLSLDANIVVWAFTPVEIRSAIWRKHRERRDDASRIAAERRLAALANAWTYVDEFNLVIRRSYQILSRHALKAADALQLAAALVASHDDPASLPFVTLDLELAAAARAEGFVVLP